jgi:hypothetical protein
MGLDICASKQDLRAVYLLSICLNMLTNQKKITPSKRQRSSQFECAIMCAVAIVLLFIRFHNSAAA